MELTGTMGGGAPPAMEVRGIGTSPALGMPTGTSERVPAAAAASSLSRERERLRDLDRSRRREARGSDGMAGNNYGK